MCESAKRFCALIWSTGLLVNPPHACTGGLRYLSCVCVCYHSIGNIHRFYAQNEVRGDIYILGYSQFLTHGFSIKPKLWREKANIQMSM